LAGISKQIRKEKARKARSQSAQAEETKARLHLSGGVSHLFPHLPAYSGISIHLDLPCSWNQLLLHDLEQGTLSSLSTVIDIHPNWIQLDPVKLC